MRKNKMKITILGCIGIFLIAALVLLPATQAMAKTVNHKITSYITKLELIRVPDVEGHVVGVYYRKGIAIFENEVAAYSTRGTIDIIKSGGKYDGSFQGYSHKIYKDGSTVMVKYQGNYTWLPGAKLPSFVGTGEYFKGTGRFEGIKGKVNFNGKYITPYSKETKGDEYIEATGTYTLPKK